MVSGFLRGISKRMSRKGLYPFLREALHGLPERSHLLNIGAGGEIAAIVRDVAATRAFTVTSSDIDGARAPDLIDDLANSSLPDASYDAIVIMEVLEHVREPAAAREMVRILRPGGQLILSTPFIFPLHDRPYDFFRYTRYGLEYLFRDFTNVRIRERNSWAEAIVVLLARLASLPGRTGTVAAILAIPLCVLCYPFALVAARLIRTDFLTTGYVLTATRPAGGSPAP